MKFVQTRIRVILFFLLLSCAAVCFLPAADSNYGTGHVDEDLPTVWISEIDTTGFTPPAGAFDLLRPNLERAMKAAGIARFVASPHEAGTDVQIRLSDYLLLEHPEGGYVAQLRIDFIFDGDHQSECSVRTIGEGDSASAAVQRAVNRIPGQLLYCLQETTLWQPTIRIIDTVAGRAVLNRGAGSGIRPGDEFISVETDGAETFVKVAEVYDGFSEAHIFRQPDEILYGQVILPVSRIGLKTLVQGRYNLIFATDTAASEATWSALLRTYIDRGLFALNPLLGLEYIQGRCSCMHLGMGLNWYFGPFLCTSSIGGQLGVEGQRSDPFYWGGFAEIALRWTITRRILLNGDVGISALYSTSSALQDFQFLYSGLGIMLKY